MLGVGAALLRPLGRLPSSVPLRVDPDTTLTAAVVIPAQLKFVVIFNIQFREAPVFVIQPHAFSCQEEPLIHSRLHP